MCPNSHLNPITTKKLCSAALYSALNFKSNSDTVLTTSFFKFFNIRHHRFHKVKTLLLWGFCDSYFWIHCLLKIKTMMGTAEVSPKHQSRNTKMEKSSVVTTYRTTLSLEVSSYHFYMLSIPQNVWNCQSVLLPDWTVWCTEVWLTWSYTELFRCSLHILYLSFLVTVNRWMTILVVLPTYLWWVAKASSHNFVHCWVFLCILSSFFSIINRFCLLASLKMWLKREIVS